MSTPLANSASEDRGASLPVSYGIAADDPTQRAFQPHPSPTRFTALQDDTPPLPVTRTPPRMAGGGAAGATPTIDHTGNTVWSGAHGAMPYPLVGSIGPDQQPSPSPFRRTSRNAPQEPWDEQPLTLAGPVSPFD